MKPMTMATMALVFSGGLLAHGGELRSCGCTASWDAKTLRVSNGCFSAAYAVRDGVVRTVSFRDADNAEWQREPADASACERISVTASAAAWSPVGVTGLCVRVTTGRGVTEINAYPGVPGVIVRAPARVPARAVHDLERDFRTLREDGRFLNAERGKADRIAFVPKHVRATSALCLDQTDIRDRLLVTDERLLMAYDHAHSLAASALDCRDVLTDRGLVFVRLAPMPLSRPAAADDFILSGSSRDVTLLANGYPLAMLAYGAGDAGRQRALIRFQRAIRPYRSGRDGVLLSNTWGGGNGDSRINQEFLVREIEAGARIGVDVIQIDDGWQHGRTANSRKAANKGKAKVWTGYWETDPDFWTADRERFPDGLAFLTRLAASKGMRFGLWFGPDSSRDAENWERDADCLIDFHRRLGIDYFKMDSMKLHSPVALERNRRMFDKMLTSSNGAMVFDLDCTAEIRPGYLGLIDIGPLFVENRYTKRSVYLPHHTLRNLWDLSHVIDPVRLRLEFNNPDTNRENYRDTPLGHGNYRADALFATVMAASPLAWMELSDVSEKSVAALAPLVRRWKAERARWHGGVIHPVGKRPDGVAWTGFVSEACDAAGGGYALLFREWNARADYALDLTPVFGATGVTAAEIIGGRGTAAVKDGILRVTVPEKLDFVWVKLRARHPAPSTSYQAPTSR